jgi:hypothetical protein
MNQFKATILILGVNPYVSLPPLVLKNIFIQAKKDKGAIPVRGTLDGQSYIQTLVKYSGEWRLYLNIPMRKAAKKDVGDRIVVTVEYDPVERIIPIHPKFSKALKKSKDAKTVFESLSPSRRKEIIRYIGFLKTEASVDRNVSRAIRFLLGNERFVGRDKP